MRQNVKSECLTPYSSRSLFRHGLTPIPRIHGLILPPCRYRPPSAFPRSLPNRRAKISMVSPEFKKLIRFCIEHWDNQFMQEIKQDLVEQKEALDDL